MDLPNINEFINDVRKEYQEHTERITKRIENGFLLVQLLASEGLYLDASSHELKWGHTFTVTPKELAIVRRVLGPLEKYRLDPVPKTRNKVWDIRRPKDERFSSFAFQFQATLPTGAKCKIVKTRRSETRRSIVCGV